MTTKKFTNIPKTNVKAQSNKRNRLNKKLIMGKSYSQTETKMQLIPEIESMEKIRAGEK